LFGEATASSPSTFRPRIVAGLDEAGLGPMLGPLTIGMSAFRVTDACTDLWVALADACTNEIGRKGERLVVADSKVVFTRTDGGAHRLESTVLAFDALRNASGLTHVDARSFLEAAAFDRASHQDLAREAWFAALPTRLARDIDDTELARRSQNLAGCARVARVELVALSVRAVPPVALNAAFARTDNKSTAHWEVCAPYLRDLWTRFASEGVEVVVDRHGGRMRYATLLRDTFAGADVETIGEVPERSEYLVTSSDGRALRIVFAEKSESFSFAVALASCAAKYAREVCMAGFNAYFGALQQGLMPTAGYVTDARRWLAEAELAIERSGIARDAIVRSR